MNKSQSGQIYVLHEDGRAASRGRSGHGCFEEAFRPREEDDCAEVALEPKAEVEHCSSAAAIRDDRNERILKIRAAIADGSYQVSAIDLAGKLIERGLHDLDLGTTQR